MGDRVEMQFGSRRAGWIWPAVMALVRTPLIVLSAGLVWVVLVVAGQREAFAWPIATALSMNLVNVASVLLLARLLRREGRRLSDLLGPVRGRLARDIGWGLCWMLMLNSVYLFGLFIPLLIAGGPAGITDGSVFEEAFVGGMADADGDGLAPTAMVFMAIWMLAFPFLNAPVEELHYRGYVQPRLHAATGRVWIAVAVSSIGFGVQHVPMAPSTLGRVTYFCMFAIWGAGAGLIYLRQQRLMPLIIAHLITNLPVAGIAIGFLVWS